MSFINYVTQIQIDFGAIQLLQQECDRVGMKRPLIVTDAGVKAAGILQKALDALPGVAVAVYDQTPSNPTEAAVREATALYKAQQCSPHHCRAHHQWHRQRSGTRRDLDRGRWPQTRLSLLVHRAQSRYL